MILRPEPTQTARMIGHLTHFTFVYQTDLQVPDQSSLVTLRRLILLPDTPKRTQVETSVTLAEKLWRRPPTS
jgi:hypothetical protein